MLIAHPMTAYNKMKYIMGWMLVVFFCQLLNAQAPVQALTASYNAAVTGVSAYSATPAPNSGSFSSCAAQNATYTFHNSTSNVLRLTDVVVNGHNFHVAN